MVKLESLENLCYVVVVRNANDVMYYNGGGKSIPLDLSPTIAEWTPNLSEAKTYNNLSGAEKKAKIFRKSFKELSQAAAKIHVNAELVHKKEVMLARLKG